MHNCILLSLGLVLSLQMNAQEGNWYFGNKLDSLLAKKEIGAKSPGFAVCIVDHGEIVYEFQTGLANLELRKPITEETIFNLGSVSKQFTAACILLLEEQGKLKRNDPIQKFIPELPDFGETITLDHLINHTSGLYGHIDVLNLRFKYKNSRLSAKAIFSFTRNFHCWHSLREPILPIIIQHIRCFQS